MANTNEITNLTIDASALDFWTVARVINELSGIEGTDDLMVAFENWRDENAIASAIKYANEGNPEAAEDILDIYDGEGEDAWTDVVSAINAARATEEPANEEEPAPAADALRDNPEYRTWDDALVWLDQMPAHDKRAYDPWKIVEEAARIHSTGAGERNIFEAGRIYGMACAIAAICPVEGADADWWLGYIEDYAEANYEDGARVDL